MSLRNKIIDLFEAHDLFDQQGSINVDHNEIGNRDHLANMWHSYDSTDYAMLETDKKSRLLTDLDGVLCDLVKAFKAKTGVTPEEYEEVRGKDEFWDLMKSWGDEFWATLPWMPDGKELWNYIKKYNPIILSSAQAGYQFRGKTKWIERNLGFTDKPIINIADWKGQSRIVYQKDKWRCILEKGDILIDDTDRKTIPWTEHGGVAILHTSAQSTISQLKKIGL